MRELHLFAGIGGGILGGMLLGHRCVGAVEIDPYCRRVLEARQRDGILKPFPIHDDIRTFDGTAWRGRVDVVCGGFPCQPWSSAGKRLGAADPRHLWPEMARVVAECRPAYVFAENVSLAAFREPLGDLQRLGYRVAPALEIGPSDLGGSQSRRRWWLLAADIDDEGQRVRAIDAQVATPCSTTLAGWEAVEWWAQGGIPGGDDGLPGGVDRDRATGNGQVPAVAAAAFRELMARLP